MIGRPWRRDIAPLCPSRITRRPGFLLGQLVVVLAIMAVLVLVLGKLIVDSIYVQRVAQEHATHVAVVDDLADRLTRDTLAASAAAVQPDGIRLVTAAPEGRSDIRYAFDDWHVRRLVGGVETGVWKAYRLRFDWHVETGARGRVLVLDTIVVPPAKATDVLPLAFSRGFVLPAAETVPELHEAAQPREEQGAPTSQPEATP